MPSCKKCHKALEDDLPKTLRAHTKAFHTPQASVTFISQPDISVTLFRDESGFFQCPACLRLKPTYMAIYSHCKNTNNSDHNKQVDTYFRNRGSIGSRNASSGGTGTSESLSSTPRIGPDNIDLMFRASQKVRAISL